MCEIGPVRRQVSALLPARVRQSSLKTSTARANAIWRLNYCQDKDNEKDDEKDQDKDKDKDNPHLRLPQQEPTPFGA